VRRALRNFRGDMRYRLGRAAALLLGPRRYRDRLSPDEIRSVLICRINARMGNALFLTPLIRTIHELIPQASIDLAIAYPDAEDLLGKLPGVRIIGFPYKGVGLAWRYLAALRLLRSRRFDLVIDPIPNSTSGRAVLMAARARYRLGYATEHQWAPLTHAVPPAEAMLHQAAQPVDLLRRAFAVPFDPNEVRLWLPLAPQELEAGRAAVSRAVAARNPAATAAHAFGFFGRATGLKRIGAGYWRQFWDSFLALQPDAIPLEFLPSPNSAPTDPRCAVMHIPSPRALTGAMAATRMFISGDTGPMHLASSQAVPTVALFCASDPALYGPLKPADLALEVKEHPPQAVAQRCARIWQRTARDASVVLPA
jgi:heptosyltransferase III